MRKKAKFIVFLFLSIFVLSAETDNKHTIAFYQTMEITTDYQIRKACYNELKNVLYVWQNETDLIHIYHHKKKINTIGRDNLKLQNLSDITLAPDGNLYMLDSIDKKIHSIDKNGLWVSSFKLPSQIYPLLFAVTKEEKFYIYDDYSSEIIVYNFNGNEEFRFGKMELSHPLKISFNQKMLSVYCQNDETLFFSKLGQFIESVDGKCFYENNLLIELKRNYLEIDGKEKSAVSIEPWQEYFFEDSNLILIKAQQIITGEFRYER